MLVQLHSISRVISTWQPENVFFSCVCAIFELLYCVQCSLSKYTNNYFLSINTRTRHFHSEDIKLLLIKVYILINSSERGNRQIDKFKLKIPILIKSYQDIDILNKKYIIPNLIFLFEYEIFYIIYKYWFERF